MKTTYAGAALAIALAVSPAVAQTVKITPLGSHEGELCANEFDGKGKCVAGC